MDKPRLFYNIDGEAYDDYLLNVGRHKNILVDASNIFNVDLNLPLHHLYLVLRREFLHPQDEKKLNLHLIVNDRKMAESIYTDIKQIFEKTDLENNCVLSYSDKEGRKRERKFIKMNLTLKRFNIYFYLINTEAPRFQKDDSLGEFRQMSQVYLLFLYTQLSQISSDVILASTDNDAYSEYILPKSFLSWLPFTLVLFQVYLPKMIQRRILNEVINMKDHLFIVNYFKNDRYGKIPRIGYHNLFLMEKTTAFTQKFL